MGAQHFDMEKSVAFADLGYRRESRFRDDLSNSVWTNKKAMKAHFWMSECACVNKLVLLLGFTVKTECGSEHRCMAHE